MVFGIGFISCALNSDREQANIWRIMPVQAEGKPKLLNMHKKHILEMYIMPKLKKTEKSFAFNVDIFNVVFLNYVCLYLSL